ncbi:MAG: LytTR family DNA-binding domain-containing protein [Sphingobium sp.]
MAADALRTLIIDDEPLAIERLQILCGQIPQINLVGTANDGDAALRLCQALTPDLLLLDIAMPGLDGIQVARALETSEKRPAIIFCTAFDDFAVEAFDVAAIDYLLKPVALGKLQRAVGRVADRGTSPGRSSDAAEQAEWIEEFWIPHKSEMIRIAATDVDRIEAERDYMRLHVGSRSYLLHQTISELERRLNPARFIRLHRSTIVRQDYIVKLAHDGLGTWKACLNDGISTRIGRTYLAKVKAMAGR